MDPIAIISDIHSNLPALEIVLADIAARGIDTIYNLGDLVGKGPDSALVVDICREVCEIVDSGTMVFSGILCRKVASMWSVYLCAERISSWQKKHPRIDPSLDVWVA